MASQMKIEKPVFIATIIIVFFAGFYFNFFFANQGVSNELNEREDFNKELINEINEKLETLSPKKLTSSTKIVAVTQQGQGVVSNAEVEIIEGKGRLLFNTNPFVEPDTQFSLDIAREVAQRVTGKSLADRDIIYSINDSESKQEMTQLLREQLTGMEALARLAESLKNCREWLTLEEKLS